MISAAKISLSALVTIGLIASFAHAQTATQVLCRARKLTKGTADVIFVNKASCPRGTTTVAVLPLKNGQDGAPGTKGDTGEQGPQGIQGIKGDKGDTGDQGLQGPKGDTGEQGVQGLSGASLFYFTGATGNDTILSTAYVPANGIAPASANPDDVAVVTGTSCDTTEITAVVSDAPGSGKSWEVRLSRNTALTYGSASPDTSVPVCTIANLATSCTGSVTNPAIIGAADNVIAVRMLASGSPAETRVTVALRCLE